MKPEQYNYYKAQINYHRIDDLKDGALPNGSIIHVQASWIADDDPFKGEWIFHPAEHLLWLPERDLTLLAVTNYEEYSKHRAL